MTHEQEPDDELGEFIVLHGEFEFTVIEDYLEFPTLDLDSKFNTIADWLTNMCEHDKPEKQITRFNFGLFESADHYTLTLTGVNTYEQADNSRICIEFTPAYTYFRLPKSYHEGLDRDRLVSDLKAELIDFTKTKTFQSSFFTKADEVVFGTTGDVIWQSK